MEIFFGVAVVAVKLIMDYFAEKRANKYTDAVVRRYD